MEILQTFNEVYEPVFTSRARYVDAWGGRGRGGSHFGTEYFLYLITKPGYFRGYFVRQAFKDIRDSLFRDFKDRITENETISIDDFHINENEMRITYLPTGNMIISKGVKSDVDRTAKMKSLAGATHVLIEEADEVGEDDFDQLDLSLRTTKADNVQILRVFNPPGKNHWIWRDYVLTDRLVVDENGKLVKGYFAAHAKTDANLLSIFSTYHDNRENIQDSTVEKFESFKKRKPEYYNTVILGLISEGMKGRIFSGANSITDEEFNAIDARSIFGQDFGSSSPAGLVEAKIAGTRLYLREHNYQGMTEKEIALLYCRLGLKDEVIIADSAEPLKIRRLRQGWNRSELTEDEAASFPQLLKGWNVYGAIKTKGSVNSGIDKIKDFETFITEGSANFWKEYREYRWALDKNKNPTDDPEDANNHLWDPTRYIVTGKGRFY